MEKQTGENSMTEKWWDEQKTTLIDNISKAMNEEAANQDVLEIMLELVKTAKVRVSAYGYTNGAASGYYEEEKEG